MRILAIEKVLTGLNPQTHSELLQEEAAHVWALQKKEVIRDIWFTCADKRAVVMMECASEAEAKEHLAGLPLVRERLITFDVFALRSYDGFDRLLGSR